MRGKHLAARRQRNRELAALDAAHRCKHCRKAILADRSFFPMSAGFCSYDCLDAAEEVAALRQVKR